MSVLPSTSGANFGSDRNFSDMGSGGAKNWCITYNNYEQECLQFNPETDQYMVCGLEIGEKNTPHIQGYIQLKKRTTLKSLKRRFPKHHLEVARGSPKQNVEYCTKDGKSHEHGELLKGQGARSDLTALKNEIDAGTSYERIRELDYGYALRYQRAIKNDIEYCRKPRSWPTELYIYWGATGTGKTRKAFESYPEAYWKTRGEWWDDYEGHETVIIDEFYGWLPISEMLRLCDRYPMQVPVKGGFRKFVAKRIIITSNVRYTEWWPSIEKTGAVFLAFERRITMCTEFKSLDIRN